MLLCFPLLLWLCWFVVLEGVPLNYTECNEVSFTSILCYLILFCTFACDLPRFLPLLSWDVLAYTLYNKKIVLWMFLQCVPSLIKKNCAKLNGSCDSLRKNSSIFLVERYIRCCKNQACAEYFIFVVRILSNYHYHTFTFRAVQGTCLLL